MTITEFINTGCGVDAVSVIYKLTNLQNGKIYIGQTKGSLRKRVISHLSHANKFTKSKKHHLQFALQKYGYNNFQIEIIEACDPSRLNDREVFWIRYYNSTDPDKGYNCTNGGDGCSIAREIKNSTKIKISEANKAKWKDEEYRKRQHDSRVKQHQRNAKKIVQLTYSYEVIKIWEYKKDICNSFGSQIYNLRGDRKSIITGGYIWMYLEDYNSMQLQEPLIVQLDKQMKVINYYYDYKTANIRIHELTGQYGNLQFNLNQKFTKLKGTRKADCIWMLYECYKQIKSK